MFKLPVCPYCKTVYNYREVVKISRKSKNECYHCGNCFKKSFILLIIPLFAAIALGIVIDIIILNLTGIFSKSIIPLIIVSWLMLIAAALVSPYFVRFTKIKGQKLKKAPDSEYKKMK